MTHFQSPTPGIFISDLKNCTNDDAHIVPKENFSALLFFYSTRKTRCRLKTWALRTPASRIRVMVPHSQDFASITTFSSSAQDDGRTRHGKHQHNRTQEAPLLSIFLPPATFVEAQAILWVQSQTYLPVSYSQSVDSSPGHVYLFMLKDFIHQECMNGLLSHPTSTNPSVFRSQPLTWNVRWQQT